MYHEPFKFLCFQDCSGYFSLLPFHVKLRINYLFNIKMLAGVWLGPQNYRLVWEGLIS